MNGHDRAHGVREDREELAPIYTQFSFMGTAFFFFLLRCIDIFCGISTPHMAMPYKYVLHMGRIENTTLQYLIATKENRSFARICRRNMK